MGRLDRPVADRRQPAPRQGQVLSTQGNELVPVLDNIGCANGLAISQDGRYLYFADSVSRGALRFDLELKSGAITNPKQLFELRADEPGFPDGATLDSEGGYWVALVGAGKLRRYLPEGTLDVEIKLPVCNPTKVSFGGPGFRTMFLTSCRLELGPALTDADGRLYRFDPESRASPSLYSAGDAPRRRYNRPTPRQAGFAPQRCVATGRMSSASRSLNSQASPRGTSMSR